MVEMMKMEKKIILASNSPRRRQLLEGLGIPFEVKTIDGIDESYPDNLPPEKIAEYIANEKAQAYVITPDELLSAARQGIIDHRVIAEGGVSLENIEQVRQWGFGGVAIRGDLWNRFDVHSGKDYKELIAHFRRLRKAVG